MRKILFFLLIVANVNAGTLNWDLENLYGVNQNGFASIIADAKNHFLNSPNDVIYVRIPAGTFNIGGNGSHGIDLNAGMNPGVNGRLIFKGKGKNNTKLIFTDLNQRMVHGRDINRVTFKGIHFARAIETATQGTVVSTSKGEIVLKIHKGFPTPLELFDFDFVGGKYLRRYTKSKSDPLVIKEDNEQVSWGIRNKTEFLPPVFLGNRKWKLFLKSAKKKLTNYQVGDLVGIKSKIAGEAYWIINSNDILFDNVRWTGSTRGLARGGTSNFIIKNSSIERGASINGQKPCMSSSSGGFQMNQKLDAQSTNMVVENCFIDSPGDDCVAFFNVNCGTVINSTLRNSFARGLLATPQASNICSVNNVIYNNPVLDDAGNAISDCTTGSGNCSSFKTTNVNEVKSSNLKLNIYPNPALSVVNVFVSNGTENSASLEIFDFIGNVIKKQELKTGSNKIDVENFPKGIFIFKVNVDNETIVKKIIKN